MNEDKILELFDKPKLIGLIADANEGKSNLIYWTIKTLRQKYTFNLYSYGLRTNVLGEKKIYSVEELEKLSNSIVIIDEFASMFDLDDRKQRKQIERTLRMIFHHNNVVLLSGLPENFKKFIASKLDAMIFKTCALQDFINGSRTKRIAYQFADEKYLGSSMLTIPLGKAIVYNPEDDPAYHDVDVPYLESCDTKKDNAHLLQPIKKRK